MNNTLALATLAAGHAAEIASLRSTVDSLLANSAGTTTVAGAVSTAPPDVRDVVVTRYVHDNAEIPTDARLVKLAGASSRHRHNCSLAPGVEEGQRLTLIGFTWSAELANPHPNVQFAQRCSHTAFGNEVRFGFCPLIYSPLSGG